MTRLTSILFCSVALSLTASAAAHANVVLQWNATAGAAAVAACISPNLNPLHESRLYAMMHIAIHDALNAIDRRSRPYAFDVQGGSPISSDAAVAAAARGVLVAELNAVPTSPECLAASLLTVEDAYTDALAGIAPGDAKTNGIELGEAAAEAIVTLRTGDGSDTPLLDFDYVQGTAPGEYRFTPGFNFVFAPGWGNVRPFVLRRSSQFRASPPYNVRSSKYTHDFDEVKQLGGDGISTPTIRTPEQTLIGLFWLESSPLQWNRIARAVAEARGLGVWESARLFGLLNMALADGYVGSWATKFHFKFWRPVTAIRLAADDGNPNTAGDETWTPLQVTYPMPDHDSAHSVQGGAAAEVLAQFFGRDDIAFEACSLSVPVGARCGDAETVWRSYSSFSQAANENATSRIYVGIHFRHASEEGAKHGRKIGKRAVNLFLRPAS